MAKRPMTQERLNELNSKELPFLNWRDIIVFPGDEWVVSQSDVEAFDKYFIDTFLDPGILGSQWFNVPIRCPGCELELRNDIVGYLISGGGFITRLEWSLAHGEAYCVECGYPFRVYHYNVGSIERFVLALPYHPSGLTVSNSKR